MLFRSSDVRYAVKPKVNGICLILTGKSAGKIRKTVYGKFFRKPFSKITQASPSSPQHFTPLILSLCSLSLSHCLLSLNKTRATPSRSPPATRLFSALFLSSARFLSHPTRAQPARAPIPLSLRRSDPTVELSHRSLHRSATPMVNPQSSDP